MTNPALPVRIVQQDGSVEVLHYADTVHNRQLVNYIERHESFALQSRNSSRSNPMKLSDRVEALTEARIAAWLVDMAPIQDYGEPTARGIELRKLAAAIERGDYKGQSDGK